ncbi:hypothetical protein [Lentisalinibacter salinarum]|uniref:hypothetical protein n=1 Tax=Lentisalinibacter salinarum TaxID=2992239 RepID=UPI00386C2FF7
MSKAYRIFEDGRTVPLNRIHVRNEERDLQRLIENNPDLLAGEQIRPEDPCRWLVVGREVGVPDPENGEDRWSLDLFFVDQQAIPTFIECKRFEDTRSRREVVAQMLDYAANANYYWDKESLRYMAETTAKAAGEDLEARLAALSPEWDEGADEFFQRVEENLREGQVRMVFLLEEAPFQLRSIVDFLNRQMERSEVLLIEARQYEDCESRIVVPSLFGYTEEARRVKRTISVDKGRRRSWNRERFLQEVSEKFPPRDVQLFTSVLDQLEAMDADMSWGTGVKTGSTNPKWQQLSQKSLISIYTDGKLSLNFPWLEEDVREKFRVEVESNTRLSIPDDYRDKYPIFPLPEWRDEANGVLGAIRALTAGLQ